MDELHLRMLFIFVFLSLSSGMDDADMCCGICKEYFSAEVTEHKSICCDVSKYCNDCYSKALDGNQTCPHCKATLGSIIKGKHNREVQWKWQGVVKKYREVCILKQYQEGKNFLGEVRENKNKFDLELKFQVKKIAAAELRKENERLRANAGTNTNIIYSRLSKQIEELELENLSFRNTNERTQNTNDVLHSLLLDNAKAFGKENAVLEKKVEELRKENETFKRRKSACDIIINFFCILSLFSFIGLFPATIFAIWALKNV